MTPSEFKAWRTGLGLSQTEAAHLLGLKRPTIELYELGHRREDNRPVEIPHPVVIATAAITAALEAETDSEFIQRIKTTTGKDGLPTNLDAARFRMIETRELVNHFFANVRGDKS